jgi:hypothetical protein
MADGPFLPELPDTIRRPARGGGGDDRRLRRLVVAGIVLAHAIGAVLLEQASEMRWRAPAAQAEQAEQAEQSFVVEFLPPDPVPPEDAPVLPAPTASTPAPRTAAQPRPESAPVGEEPGLAVQFLPAEPPLESRRLFDPDGRVRLPEGLVTRGPAAPRDPMAPREVLPFERTRFDRAWVPDGENLGQSLVRKVPPLGLILQGVNGDPCPPNSEDPACEAQVRAQRAYIPPTPQSGDQPW